jgi:citrate lyase alpha subunit
VSARTTPRPDAWVVGIVEYRDGSVIDVIRRCEA